MSSPAVTERVRRLEEAGVIQGYRLELNPTALGLPIAALCAYTTKSWTTFKDYGTSATDF